LALEFPDGVEAVRVLGWPHTTNAKGLNIQLGEVYAGQTKQVVVQLRIKGKEGYDTQVAKAVLEYHDSLFQEPATLSKQVTATMTDKPHIVTQSENLKISVRANEALSNWYLKKANKAFREGDVSKRTEVLKVGMKHLETTSKRLNSRTLHEQQIKFRSQSEAYRQVDATSLKGKQLLKSADKRATYKMRNQ
jgi:hypothetical protein